MAQIDASIPLQAMTANVGQAFSQGQAQAQEREAQKQANQIRQFQLESLQREQQNQDAIRNAIAGAGGDINAALPDIMKIDPTTGLNLQQQQLDRQKTIAQTQKAVAETDNATLEHQLKVTTAVDQKLSPVLQLYQTMVGNGMDPNLARQQLQPKYLMTLQDMQRDPILGPIAKQAPTEFDPQAMIAHQKAAMSYKDAAQLELENRKQKETEKYHSAVLGMKREELSQKQEALLDDATINQMASQYLAGDKSVMQNLGRGAQGAQNIVKLRRAISNQAQAQGMSGAQVAAKMAEFEGTKAGERTLGTRTANIEMAVNEAYNLADQALKTSASVPRTEFKTLNDMALAIKRGTGDEATARFYAAHNAFVNAASRAISPSGTPTVNDKEHVREILDKGYSQGQYQAAVDQIKKEMEQARKSPGQVRKEFRESVTDGASKDVINFDDLPE